MQTGGGVVQLPCASTVMPAGTSDCGPSMFVQTSTGGGGGGSVQSAARMADPGDPENTVSRLNPFGSTSGITGMMSAECCELCAFTTELIATSMRSHPFAAVSAG